MPGETESERTTRRRRIDPRLEAAGWQVVPFDLSRPIAAYHGCAVTEFPTAEGPVGYARRSASRRR